MIYYISDTHLGDLKVFNKCHRPFANLEEMHSVIIDKWNNKVGNNDKVYVLGDLVDEDKPELLKVFKKLNGKKHLIVGNHDTKNLCFIKESNIFDSIDFIKLIEDLNHKVCLCHYPLMDWMEFNRNGLHIYGHIHNKTNANGIAYAQIKEYYKDKAAFNASVDVCDFEPKTLMELMTLKEENKNESYIN